MNSETKATRIAIAASISEVGNSLRQLVMALAIFSVQSSVRNLATAEVVETCGVILMMLIAPFFIDRISKKRALVVGDLSGFLTALILFSAVSIGRLSILYVGAFLMTFVGSFHSTCLNNVTVSYSTSGGSSVRRLLSKLQSFVLVGSLVGLIGASIFLPHVSFKWFFLVDALSFIVSGFLAWTVVRSESTGFDRAPNKIVSYGQLLSEWGQGFQFIKATPRLRFIVCGNLFSSLSYGIFEAVSVGHQKSVIGLSDAMVSIARVFTRSSALLGSFFMMKWSSNHKSKDGKSLIVLGGLSTAFGLLMMPFQFVGSYFTGLAGYNFGLSVTNPTLSASLSEVTPPEMLGRVSMARGLIIYGAVLAGNILVATGLAIFSTGQLLVAAGCLTVLAMSVFRTGMKD